VEVDEELELVDTVEQTCPPQLSLSEVVDWELLVVLFCDDEPPPEVKT
jgi:hypothetical protein